MDIDALNTLLGHLDILFEEKEYPKDIDSNETVLVVDLDTRKSSTFELPVLKSRTYISGPLLSARIWADFVGSEIDTVMNCEADNPVVICPSKTGGKGTIAFRSPQTKSLFFNFCSSDFSSLIRDYGYSAIVITGRLDSTGIVKIKRNETHFDISDSFKNLTTSQITDLIGNISIVTGPAGDNYIRFANTVSGKSSSGRGGLGMVFGLKNLKGIYFDKAELSTGNTDKKEGKNQTENTPDDNVSYFNVPHLIEKGMKAGWVAIDNYRRRTDPRLFYLTDKEFNRHIEKYKNSLSVPSYNERIMLGANLESFSPLTILVRYNCALDMGFDPISLGNFLGWTKEAQEKGEKVFDVSFDFSDNNYILSIIKRLATKDFQLCNLLDMYNESPYAYSINGLECDSFDYRGNFAQALNSVLENNFFVYPSFYPNLFRKDLTFWVKFNEELVFGLQSLDLSCSYYIFELETLNKYRFFLFPFLLRKKAEYFISLRKYLKKYNLNIKAVMKTGKKCKYFVREINNFLNKNKPKLPDYFCVNSNSNSLHPAIVPIVKLIDSYSSIDRKPYPSVIKGLSGKH